MTIPFLIQAVLVIAAALCVIMSGAWIIQSRTGNSGWVDTIWTFGLGAVGIASALAPLPDGTEWGVSHYRLKPVF